MAEITSCTVFTDEENALLSSIETRLAEEMVRLVFPLREFARRSQLISKEIPDNAHFCKLVSGLLPLVALQFSNALLQSVSKRTFVKDGRLYLEHLGLSLNDFIREVDLDGKKFLAVALIERELTKFDSIASASLKNCNHCGSFHYDPHALRSNELSRILDGLEKSEKQGAAR